MQHLTVKILGKSLGLDVLGGIDFPIVGSAALRTNPSLFLVGNCILELSTSGTSAGCGCVALYGNELFSLAFQLVTQELPEHPITRL